jgi:hypothetical protein
LALSSSCYLSFLVFKGSVLCDLVIFCEIFFRFTLGPFCVLGRRSYRGRSGDLSAIALATGEVSSVVNFCAFCDATARFDSRTRGFLTGENKRMVFTTRPRRPQRCETENPSLWPLRSCCEIFLRVLVRDFLCLVAAFPRCDLLQLLWLLGRRWCDHQVVETRIVKGAPNHA